MNGNPPEPEKNPPPMKAVLLVAAAASLALPVAVRAETPEEAVAYAFVGLSDGANLTRDTTTMSWKHAAGSPAVYEGHGSTAGPANTTSSSPCEPSTIATTRSTSTGRRP